MKKYLLPISITINVVLVVVIIVFIIMFFSLKDKVSATIEQVINGQYTELIITNSSNIRPEGLKNFTQITAGESECDYFYQKTALLVTYLEVNPTVPSSIEYADQLDLLKTTVGKTPSALKQTACKKGISTINYLSEKLSIQSK